MRTKEKEVRRFLSIQRNRTLRNPEKQSMISDFIKYIDALVQIFRLSEKLDAAGDTLTRIFRQAQENGPKKSDKSLSNFKNWIINFDIWGSYLPLSEQSWDI